MIVYASNFGYCFKGSHPGGAGAVRRLRGHKCVSKALSVTLTRATSPGVRGFKLVCFTRINSRLSFRKAKKLPIISKMIGSFDYNLLNETLPSEQTTSSAGTLYFQDFPLEMALHCFFIPLNVISVKSVHL